MRVGMAVVAAALVAGCHARFQGAVQDLGSARPEVRTTAPAVHLKAPAAERARARAVEGQLAVGGATVSGAVHAGLADALGAGPPFSLTEDPAAPLLQLELVRASLELTDGGRSGQVTHVVRVQIFDASGRRVYRDRHRCTEHSPELRVTSPALYLSNHRKQLPGVEPEAIRLAFEEAAWRCGEEVALRLRAHASPSELEALGAQVAELARPRWTRTEEGGATR